MSNNTKLGVGSLNSNNGSRNTAIGAYASYKNTEGFSNTSLGVNAGFFNETGDWNTSLGSAALCNNLNGSSNTAIGSNALLGTKNLSIGNHNTGVGVQSLEENTGDFNTALGAQSGLDLSGSSYNTYLGAKTNATGQGLNHSTAIGYEAKITDSNQIMMGTANETVEVPGKLDVSGQSTFSTDLNVRGITVGRGISDKKTNVVFGRNALESITTAGRNVAIGENALNSITTKYNNTAVGYDSLKNNIGANNSALGKDAGLNVNGSASDNNTFLGAFTDVDNSGINYENSTALGARAKITDSNQIMMGTASETVKVPGNLEVDGPAYLTNYVNQNDPNQVVPKSYVDALASGIVPTQACLCATTGDLDLTSPAIPGSGDTDGVDLSSLSDGSYNILVRDQSNNKVENGVYIFTKNSGSGSWARPSSEPMNNGFDANAAFSFVASGTIYGKVGLVQIRDPAIVGTNELEYTEFYQLQVNAGEGLNTTVQSGQLYINVDTSLNIVEYLDNNAGDLHLGANTLGNVVIDNIVDIKTNLGQGSKPAFKIEEEDSSINALLTVMNTGNGSYNPATEKDNIAIIAQKKDMSGNRIPSTLQLSTHSSNNNIIKIDSSYVLIGAGGSLSEPNTSVKCDGSNVTIKGETVKVPGNLEVDGQSTLQDVEIPGTLNVDGQATFVQNDITVSSTSDRPILIGSGPKTIDGNIIENIRFGRECMDSSAADLSGNGNNIAIGHRILKYLTTGESNTFVGSNGPGENITASSFNVGIGPFALRSFDGQKGRCTAIGSEAGKTATGGFRNTFLGAGTDFDDGANGHVHSTAIGYNAKIDDSHQIMMGTASETVEVPGTLSYQSFRQPIILSCQIGRDDTDTNQGYYFKQNTGFYTTDGSDGVIYIGTGFIQIQLFIPGINPSAILATDYTIQVTGIRETGNSESNDPLYFGVNKQYVNDNNDTVIRIIINNSDGRQNLNDNNTGNIDVTVFYYPPSP